MEVVIRIIGNRVECNGYAVAELLTDAPVTVVEEFRELLQDAVDELESDDNDCWGHGE